MPSILYLDSVGGLAGDMLLASLVDAGASLDAIQSGLPLGGIDLQVERVERQGTAGLKLSVMGADDRTHRTWRDVRQLIDAGTMPERARTRAHKAFALLAEAEGRVHGLPPDQVHFHEVGALDSIADICGVALALEDLDIDEVVCSPLPLGRGVTRGAHGVMPVPAPATADLLRGAEVFGVDIFAETVTPTGATLAASLVSGFGPCPPMTLVAIGVGAGTADFPSRPNVVRSLVGARARSLPRDDGPLVLETNLDDMQPEFVPDVLTACLAAGALDVWTTPALMKHGRPGITLAALVNPATERDVAEAILRHTTTLGVRVRRSEHRWALSREFLDVEVFGMPVSVKIGRLDGEVLNIKPEHSDCVRVAQNLGRSVKAVWQAALAQAHQDLSPSDGAGSQSSRA